MSARNDFGDRIKRLRLLAGLTGRQLDELAGLKSPGLVSQIERRSRPKTTAWTIAAIADVFGVSLDYLFLGVGARPSDEEVLASVGRAKARGARRPKAA